jgi:hypothetical protein
MAKRGGDDSNGVEPPGAVRGLVAALPAWFAIVLGLAIAAGFFLAVAGLWGLADESSSQQVWDRREALYATLTTLFGAVVGAVFGIGAISPQVGRAETRAASAEADARRHAEAAARERGDRSVAVERSRAEILRLAMEATHSHPQIVVDESTFDGEDEARAALAMALAHEGPVEVIGSSPERGGSPLISLADLAAIVEEARVADSGA